MQLFALNHRKEVIDSLSADKGTTYFCPECAAPLHLRGGPVRQNHFYHLRSTSYCRQSKKSLEHLQVQLYLKQHLFGVVYLEHRFAQIERIADVFWPEQKLIFEVQCSSITGEEILRRNADYAKLGLTVVWILHDKRYGQLSYTCAEAALKYHPHYYTNFDKEGTGSFYDQAFVYCHPLIRTAVSQRVKVDLSKPVWKRRCWKLPAYLKSRAQWKVSFEKDLKALLQQKPNYLYKNFEQAKALFQFEKVCKPLFNLIKKAAKSLWKRQLERACR